MSAGLYQAIRGMNDVLPSDVSVWQYVESVCRAVVGRYAYQEIRFPVLEKTALFQRTVGEVTDIVEKEMYTFLDRNGDSLSLRPEGTAACVRAAIQNGLLHNAIQRLWYVGAMYRHERPQKGRYRQFHQFGVESFGVSSVQMEVEQLLLAHRIFEELGISDVIHLEINSLGSKDCRVRYKAALVEYFHQYRSLLDEDAERRLQTNPLRILDSKNPDVKKVVANAPLLSDYWSEESQGHFESVCQQLDMMGIDYTVNSRLVRGLDYYCHTVYEWVTDALGAQGTVCAGGRYDGLVEKLGGKPTPAVGFSMGLERVVLLMEEQESRQFPLHAYWILVGEKAQAVGMQLAESFRDQLPGLHFEVNVHGGSFKSQFKRADKSGALFALILGEDELASGVIGVKNLRERSSQQSMTETEVIALLKEA